jgi:hypothetical protein
LRRLCLAGKWLKSKAVLHEESAGAKPFGEVGKYIPQVAALAGGLLSFLD